MSYLKRACDSNEAQGCYLLGLGYAENAGVPADSTRGRELVKKGCDLGHAEACKAMKR